jgi:hypothetical protein
MLIALHFESVGLSLAICDGNGRKTTAIGSGHIWTKDLVRNKSTYFLTISCNGPTCRHIMNTTLSNAAAHRSASPAYQAFRILQVAFVAAPILAGLDKFFHLLVNWDQYLPAIVAQLSPIGGHNLMLVVGVIEIIAGIGVALKPRIFAYVVAAWLVVIIANLLLIPGYFDIALRDFGLFLGALALARLSQQFAAPNKS